LGDSSKQDLKFQKVKRPQSSLRTQPIFLVRLLLPLLLAANGTAQVGPTLPAQPVDLAALLPEAPQPQSKPEKQDPCRVTSRSQYAGATLVSATAQLGSHVAGITPAPPDPQTLLPETLSSPASQPECPPTSIIDPFARFISEPGAAPLTRKHKAALALNNIIDPFNAVTILGTAAISVGSDSHSPYGPGLKGFSKNVGVAYTQDITGEFLGTFLIPSIAHQDPRYFRMPRASIPRRVLNAILQVYWSRSDGGKGMPNYAAFVGSAINAEIMNLYVPGIQTDLDATAQRYVTGLATAPIDNFITEFLPDVASHIHVRVVLVQRIINQVARTEPGGSP
jgi:hypothetical protein